VVLVWEIDYPKELTWNLNMSDGIKILLIAVPAAVLTGEMVPEEPAEADTAATIQRLTLN
jgi:hypothetical protein